MVIASDQAYVHHCLDRLETVLADQAGRSRAATRHQDQQSPGGDRLPVDGSLPPCGFVIPLLDRLPIGIMILGLSDGHILFLNTEAECILGVPRERLTECPLADGYGPDGGRWICLDLGGRRPLAPAELPFQRLGTESEEVIVGRPDGRRRHVRITTIPVYDSLGRPVAIAAAMADITAGRQAEQEMRRAGKALRAEVERRTRDLMEANRQLESLFNISSESIWVSDCSGKVLKISPASEKLLKTSADRIVGRNVRELIDEGLMDRSATLEVLLTKRRISMIQHVPKNQQQLLVTGTPIFDDKGEISLVMVVERDLTELNRLREDLEHSQLVSSKFRQHLRELSMSEVRQQRVVAESPQMQDVLRTAIKLASQNVSNILILGESGTGKGLLSKFIHENGFRKEAPFIQINCAALPETLLEAELFGYEKGAFTGARKEGKAGLFELAQKGTLFLDEVGDLPLSIQAKLLKYLDDNTVRHLGGLRPIVIDCTIIAATNIDLAAQVRQERFRRDLYYRLNSFTLAIPPLRQRREDIFELTRLLIERYNEEFNAGKRLSAAAFDDLMTYHFPGNVRELEAIIRKAVVLSEGDLLDDVVYESLDRDRAADGAAADVAGGAPGSLEQQNLAFERQILKNALQRCKSTRELAYYLRTSQSSIVRKLKKHGLSS